MYRPLPCISAILALTFSSCGGKKEEVSEGDKPSGPQTGPGMILEAAQKAKDKANDQTRRLEDAAGN